MVQRSEVKFDTVLKLDILKMRLYGPCKQNQIELRNQIVESAEIWESTME